MVLLGLEPDESLLAAFDAAFHWLTMAPNVRELVRAVDVRSLRSRIRRLLPISRLWSMPTSRSSSHVFCALPSLVSGEMNPLALVPPYAAGRSSIERYAAFSSATSPSSTAACSNTVWVADSCLSGG